LRRVQRKNDLIEAVCLREQAALGGVNRQVVGGNGHLCWWNSERCDSSSGES
jgi:hypothetical protein